MGVRGLPKWAPVPVCERSLLGLHRGDFSSYKELCAQVVLRNTHYWYQQKMHVSDISSFQAHKAVKLETKVQIHARNHKHVVWKVKMLLYRLKCSVKSQYSSVVTSRAPCKFSTQQLHFCPDPPTNTIVNPWWLFRLSLQQRRMLEWQCAN